MGMTLLKFLLASFLAVSCIVFSNEINQNFGFISSNILDSCEEISFNEKSFNSFIDEIKSSVDPNHSDYLVDYELLHNFTKRNKPNKRDYEYNPYVPYERWIELKPYFLPSNHPVKKKLDRIFQRTRATLSEEFFVGAGFEITRLNRPFNALVSGHKDLKGYLIKVYLDSQFAIKEWEMWLRRIKGACLIEECIEKHGFTSFCVPRKWIYPLPSEPSPPLDERYTRKNFILVVEDMHILSHTENQKAYRGKMTRGLLKELYTVIVECQLTDCMYIGNIPFTKFGKIAFVDTELFLHGSPDFFRLKKKLSAPMQAYLDELISGHSD